MYVCMWPPPTKSLNGTLAIDSSFQTLIVDFSLNLETISTTAHSRNAFLIGKYHHLANWRWNSAWKSTTITVGRPDNKQNYSWTGEECEGDAWEEVCYPCGIMCFASCSCSCFFLLEHKSNSGKLCMENPASHYMKIIATTQQHSFCWWWLGVISEHL